MSKHKKAHRADDKRGPGLGNNVKQTVGTTSTGAAPPLANLFHDRRGANGSGKRAR